MLMMNSWYSQAYDEVANTSETCTAFSSDSIRATPTVFSGATSARSAGARFSRPMISPSLGINLC